MTLLAWRQRLLGIARKIEWLPPLLVRILLGLTFIQTGWGKLHDIPGTTENFVGWHIPFPHFNAVIASATEFLGGCAILLGLGTRLAALPLTFVMFIAILTAKWPSRDGWTDLIGWDETLYAALFIWLALAGAGKASIDQLIARRWR